MQVAVPNFGCWQFERRTKPDRKSRSSLRRQKHVECSRRARVIRACAVGIASAYVECEGDERAAQSQRQRSATSSWRSDSDSEARFLLGPCDSSSRKVPNKVYARLDAAIDSSSRQGRIRILTMIRILTIRILTILLTFSGSGGRPESFRPRAARMGGLRADCTIASLQTRAVGARSSSRHLPQ